MIKTYNKLVRDRTPEVIRVSGKECEVSVVSGKENTELLEKKLMQEVGEFWEDIKTNCVHNLFTSPAEWALINF